MAIYSAKYQNANIANNPVINYQKNINIDTGLGPISNAIDIGPRYFYNRYTDRTTRLFDIPSNTIKFSNYSNTNNTGLNRDDTIKENKKTIIGRGINESIAFDSASNGYKYSYSIAGPQKPSSLAIVKQGALPIPIPDQNLLDLNNKPIVFDQNVKDYFDPPASEYDTCPIIWICIKDI